MRVKRFLAHFPICFITFQYLAAFALKRFVKIVNWKWKLANNVYFRTFDEGIFSSNEIRTQLLLIYLLLYLVCSDTIIEDIHTYYWYAWFTHFRPIFSFYTPWKYQNLLNLWHAQGVKKRNIGLRCLKRLYVLSA